ncbi:rhombosortase [Aeromonas enteropelogenes]|uniref:rhombosortase n=1 Tax=Aeromonas enteropelogenes TaxID=29489 RepID=UPI003BA058AE
MLSEKSGWLWVITLSLASLLLFFTVPNLQLSFDRDLIAQGEGWRIITGNLVHTNQWHLLLNLGGLTILYSLFRDYLGYARLPVLMLLLWCAVGLGIWWLCPQTHWYMGLSGSLHGLFMWGAMQDLRHGRRISGWLMLAGMGIKLAVDFYNAGESPISTLIGARVHIESHLIGAGAGLLLGLHPVSITHSTRH